MRMLAIAIEEQAPSGHGPSFLPSSVIAALCATPSSAFDQSTSGNRSYLNACGADIFPGSSHRARWPPVFHSLCTRCAREDPTRVTPFCWAHDKSSPDSRSGSSF